MKLAVMACWMVCVFATPALAAPKEPPPVKDEASGITFSVKGDTKLIATSKEGKVIWEVVVIKAAGAPTVGQPVVRALMLKDGKLHAIYGKHNFADFDTKTGKLLAAGSD